MNTGYWQTTRDAVRAHQGLPFGEVFLWGMISIGIFVVVQGYPLIKDGQTWGKKLVHTRIVTMDGRIPSITQLCLRYFIVQLIAIVPYVRLLTLVDVLMVFRDDKRCAHDLLAGTQVIDVFRERPA